MRHPDARRRNLIIKRVTRITPHMVRITLTGDLEGFYSPGFDDHVKLFFPGDGERVMRDYTPRRYDAAANELDIEFAVHDNGPATAWATAVKPGDTLSIGGPRGSHVLQGEFDWHLFVADEAGLPAVARRLGELPVNTQALVIAEVEDEKEHQSFECKAPLAVTWVHRNGTPAGQPNQLLAALAKQGVPAGVGYTWIATESHVARALRNHLLNERGFDKQWVKAAGYWKHGEIAAHDRFDD